MSVDPITGHSLGKPSFVEHEDYQPPSRDPHPTTTPAKPHATPHVGAQVRLAATPSPRPSHDLLTQGQAPDNPNALVTPRATGSRAPIAVRTPSDVNRTELHDPLAPASTPGRENVGLLDRDLPGEAPGVRSAVQQPDLETESDRALRELTAKHTRILEQNDELKKALSAQDRVTKVRRR